MACRPQLKRIWDCFFLGMRRGNFHSRFLTRPLKDKRVARYNLSLHWWLMQRAYTQGKRVLFSLLAELNIQYLKFQAYCISSSQVNSSTVVR